MIAKILILFLAFSNAARAFTPKQFKELAHEMVNDLEKAYGSTYVDEGVTFDLNEYRKLIDRTNIDTRREQIENISEILTEKSQIIKIREVVDAVNYFPKEETILYFEQAWSDRFQKKKFDELKILIHHEFVPYFKKSADRQHIHSVKLRDIYQGSLSFEKLKPGFYEIMNLNDLTFSALDSYYILHLSYDKYFHRLVMRIVEDPRKGIWCLDCYLMGPDYLQLERSKNGLSRLSNAPAILSVKKGMDQSEGLDDYRGYPFIKMLTEDSIGLGFMDDTFKGTLQQWLNLKTTESRLVFLNRISNFNGANWLRENKKIPLNGFRFTVDEKRCNRVLSKLKNDIVDLCLRYKNSILPEINASYCSENEIKTFDAKEGLFKNLLTKYKCAYVLQLEPPTVDIPAKFRDLYQHTIQSWQRLLDEHIRN